MSAGFTFLTNYSHVLVCLIANPEARLRDIAVDVGITERAVQRIVGELEAEGYLEVYREGRRNRYRVITDRPLRHPLEAQKTVGDLLALVGPPKARGDGPEG